MWLFGYGSLVWNPSVRYLERRPAKLHGYHRRFCLWSRINRAVSGYAGHLGDNEVAATLAGAEGL